VSELVSLTWAQVIRRDSGEAQLSIVGNGDKSREVLIPATIAAPLFASRADAGVRVRAPIGSAELVGAMQVQGCG
jgi:hypothetical protein